VVFEAGATARKFAEEALDELVAFGNLNRKADIPGER
jgi:hypothetical protein